ncbi:MAG TPA: PspC domain-containing protein [Candidatus Limnocylindrales bacterium]|nr:PspC domain-containing protein [Candidatus Limnocylindrales bacterium]
MIKKLERPKNGRKIAGVALGIANYFGIDVTLVRIIWALLFLPGGLPGLIPYLLFWALMPSEEKTFETKQTS